MTLFEYDSEIRQQGCGVLCGVDEAGRGPLAGPVVAGAVILPDGVEIVGLNDSKKLSEKKRENLYDMILEKALYYGIGYASHEEIDEINILNATYLAMRRAVENLLAQGAVGIDLLLVDGNRDPKIGYPTRTLVKGDGTSASIAAASILAKVTRDREMLQLDQEYPAYGFAKHKGYPTKAHYQAIEENGICPIHRKTFLKKVLG